MSTTVTPPPKKTESHRTRSPELQGREDHAVRRLRAQLHLRAYCRMLLRSGCAALECGEILRHRLLVEIAGVLFGAVAWLQRCPRTHAVGRHRRHARQSHGARHRCHRRRRYGLHRHGPVHAPSAPQSSVYLHHRRQRRLRADEGPVFGHGGFGLEAEDRRHQRSTSVRLLRAWLCGAAQLLWRDRSPATRNSSRPF